MSIKKLLMGAVASAVILGAMVAPTSAAKPTVATTPTVVVVTPDDLAADNLGDDLLERAAAHSNGKWFFYDDNSVNGLDIGIDNSLGSFVTGPGSAPLGLGGVQISVPVQPLGTPKAEQARRNLATYRFSGTRLADITTLKFSTYNPSAGNGGAANRSGYLNFNVDFNGTDGWQSRLIFAPKGVNQNSWQEWDAIDGGRAKWHYSGPSWPGPDGATAVPGKTEKTWAQILAEYPGVRIRVTDSWLGIRVGAPYPNGYTENIDAFKFGTAAGTAVFDFEPGAEFCKNGGWENSSSPNFKNQGDCVSYVQSNEHAAANKSR